MTKRPSPKNRLIDDSELRFILENYDSVEPLTRASEASLAADILAQIDGMPGRSVPTESWFKVWVLECDWSIGLAALAVVLILVSAIMIDRVSYGNRNEFSLADANIPALMTLSDDEYASKTSGEDSGEQ